MSDKEKEARVRAAVRAHHKAEQQWVDNMNALAEHAPEIMQGPKACSPEVRKMFNETISIAMGPSLIQRILEAERPSKKKRKKR